MDQMSPKTTQGTCNTPDPGAYHATEQGKVICLNKNFYFVVMFSFLIYISFLLIMSKCKFVSVTLCA